MDEEVVSSAKIAIVTGGSRGLGHGVVQALVGGGIRAVAVARDEEGVKAVGRECQGVETVVADAADEIVAGRLLQERKPDLNVLCAGASALLRPLHYHTWESFSQN
jgi:NADP-dependent 3-hydroxy acid dehydrogenase YdfG